MTLPARPESWRRLLAEFLGTGMLVTVIVGSGIAASRLSTDPGLRLLENGLATALGLAVVILMVGPVSGAHLNPLVSIADGLLGRRNPGALTARAVIGYGAMQFAGAIGGAVLADAMFGVPTTISVTERASWPHLLAEVVATAGLVLLIFSLARAGRPAVTAAAVGAYVGAAYWFTSSTAFANPAITVGRMFSDTFAGIAPLDALAFVAAQLVGAAIGIGLVLLLHPGAAATADRAVVPIVEEPRRPQP